MSYTDIASQTIILHRIEDHIASRYIILHQIIPLCIIPYHVPAPPNYPLRDPKYHLIETIRPPIEVHWGVLVMLLYNSKAEAQRLQALGFDVLSAEDDACREAGSHGHCARLLIRKFI